MKVGMIGLGIMGKPMAKNLLKAGYDLTVSSFNKAADELAALGAKKAANAEIGASCDVVLTMLPNSPRSSRSCWGKTAWPPTCAPVPPLST